MGEGNMMDTKYENLAKTLTDQLDELVTSFGDLNINDLKTFYYDNLAVSLRKKVSTSSGFTGIPEYILFRYVLKYFKEKLRIKEGELKEKAVEGQKEGEENYTFEWQDKNGNKFKVSHDLALKRSMLTSSESDSLKLKPDIAIIKNDELIAVIEIKLCFVSNKVSEGEKKRIDDLTKLGKDVLIFYIYLLPDTIPQEYKDKPNEHIKFIQDDQEKIKNAIRLESALDLIRMRLEQ
ncbi:hypothetical protein COV19_03400 [Candidatus Woesearchaeota archaeon CG10_big_fil_rev_8_21_14_0_10_44_13]|nr:MAG: hypothetical protein COV19_03400 [Candidatus Woesearchaeota archaeon CG10_big_fil_rev_8_21_14_0_10_44_13]